MQCYGFVCNVIDWIPFCILVVRLLMPCCKWHFTHLSNSIHTSTDKHTPTHPYTSPPNALNCSISHCNLIFYSKVTYAIRIQCAVYTQETNPKMSIVIQSACNKSTEINYNAAIMVCMKRLSIAHILPSRRYFYFQLVVYVLWYCWFWMCACSFYVCMSANGGQIATLCNLLNPIQKTL